MILIIDNNNARGKNIATILKSSNCNATHYKFVTGETERGGDWDELKTDFENLIGSNTILFIHKNNSRSENAAKLFLEKGSSNQVILFSGGGNFIAQITNQNFFAFQGKVIDDAKSEWDLDAFAKAVIDKGNVFEALQSYDLTLEKLLEPFATYHPLATPPADLKAKKTELQTYVNTKLSK